MTIDEFLSQRPDMPDAGQWTELVHGKPCSLEPPDFMHGAAVLSFSKALGAFLQANRRGYAVFDVGIVVARSPDTIRYPAVSYYKQGRMFEQVDSEVADSPPHWVVDVVSTMDRQLGMSTRIEQFFDRGVELIWVLDTRQQELSIWTPGRRSKILQPGDTASAAPILDQFEIAVADLFREPPW